MGLLGELHREGVTICMVTHDPRYARHADRTVHLFDGRIVEEEEIARKQREAAELKQAGFEVAWVRHPVAPGQLPAGISGLEE